MKLFNKLDFIISKQGISSIERVMIGGIQQSILIQTESPGSPVLLFIHGGPSMPVPGVANRGTDYALITTIKQLVKQFTVIFWDQRGTGKSFSKHIQKKTMNLNQYISDAKDLTDYLLKRFNQQKIHIIAHSWGTVIGLNLAHKYPEKYYSYTGFSQIPSWVENDKISYKWLLEEVQNSKNKKALKELLAVGEPPYTKDFKQWSIIRKWQLNNKSMFYDAGDNISPTMISCLKIMLNSPDYSLMDIYNSLVRGFKLAYSNELLHDINNFNFFKEVPSLQIPVMFIHGTKEKHVFPELIISYYEQLDAPKGKALHWSNLSSHVFHIQDAKENEQKLIQFLKGVQYID